MEENKLLKVANKIADHAINVRFCIAHDKVNPTYLIGKMNTVKNDIDELIRMLSEAK